MFLKFHAWYGQMIYEHGHENQFLKFWIPMFLFCEYILLIRLLHLSHFFSPIYSPLLCNTFPPTSPPSLSWYPWVIHVSSLASTFPILFLTGLFYTYQLCSLFPVPFHPFSPHHLPADKPPWDLHFCDSVPVLIVCLVSFCFCIF